MRNLLLWMSLAACLGATTETYAQRPDQEKSFEDREFVSEYLAPTRIVCADGLIRNADCLMEPFSGQVAITDRNVAVFRSTPDKKASILLDFGEEIHGRIQIFQSMSPENKPVRFRLCLGESVTEALSDVGCEGTTATNDHAVRDLDILVPWLGMAESGNSGFRFARLDLLDCDKDVNIAAIRAVSRYRDIPWLGSFRCNDERLNEIWRVGARTVHLNMQDYIWDGIKRDRLVWIGDMHPEILAVNTVFGDHPLVRKSLDFIRDRTPEDRWMHDFESYSMWWILMQHHLYTWYGDLDYLAAQHDFMAAQLRKILDCVRSGREDFKDGRFIDWPTRRNPGVAHAGLQALAVMALESGGEIMGILKDTELQQACLESARRMREYVPDHLDNNQAAALLGLSGLLDPHEAAQVILANGPEGFATFMGYSMLEALALDGKYAEAQDLISAYWGAMLDLGATSYWENFNYAEAAGAGRIDEIVPEGKYDIHADGGDHCYVGLRQSLCHGWGAGPTTWLSMRVLGIEPAAPGFRKVRIRPHLGRLEWAEGSFPTPYGVIKVSHRKKADGTVSSQIKLPKGIKLVKS